MVNLGDVFDEGGLASPSQWQRYVARYDGVFASTARQARRRFAQHMGT